MFYVTGSGSFLLESTLDNTELRINHLQFGLENMRDYDIEVTDLADRQIYAREFTPVGEEKFISIIFNVIINTASF